MPQSLPSIWATIHLCLAGKYDRLAFTWTWAQGINRQSQYNRLVGVQQCGTDKLDGVGPVDNTPSTVWLHNTISIYFHFLCDI